MAKFILEHARDEENYKMVWLHTGAAAISFWRRFGFEPLKGRAYRICSDLLGKTDDEEILGLYLSTASSSARNRAAGAGPPMHAPVTVPNIIYGAAEIEAVLDSGDRGQAPDVRHRVMTAVDRIVAGLVTGWGPLDHEKILKWSQLVPRIQRYYAPLLASELSQRRSWLDWYVAHPETPRWVTIGALRDFPSLFRRDRRDPLVQYYRSDVFFVMGFIVEETRAPPFHSRQTVRATIDQLEQFYEPLEAAERTLVERWKTRLTGDAP
jgi:hypothetical protein